MGNLESSQIIGEMADFSSEKTSPPPKAQESKIRSPPQPRAKEEISYRKVHIFKQRKVAHQKSLDDLDIAGFKNCFPSYIGKPCGVNPSKPDLPRSASATPKICNVPPSSKSNEDSEANVENSQLSIEKEEEKLEEEKEEVVVATLSEKIVPIVEMEQTLSAAALETPASPTNSTADSRSKRAHKPSRRLLDSLDTSPPEHVGKRQRKL